MHRDDSQGLLHLANAFIAAFLTLHLSELQPIRFNIANSILCVISLPGGKCGPSMLNYRGKQATLNVGLDIYLGTEYITNKLYNHMVN